MVEGLVRMMNGPDDFVGPVNLGNPGEYSMLELAENIVRLTGSKSGIEFRPSPMDDPRRRQPDITLAKEKLGWEPGVGLQEGLQKTIAYFREISGRA
jgi:UDP-glucuronate decarboxylase